MNIVIVEDELPAYKRLTKLLQDVVPAAKIVAHLDSIQTCKEWFATHPLPNLVFMDIHLADGSAFDLLKQVKIECPLIFTTAYDQYAMEAFKTASIDYLLKPVKSADLEGALKKLKNFKEIFGNEDKSQPEQSPPQIAEYKKRFLVRFGEHIKTVSVTDIAYCYSENKATFARTFEGRNYPMDYNLDALEHMLDPQDFFRINRQYLISLKSIEEMRTYTKARVIVKLNPTVKEQPVVSSERAADFKNWLAGEYK
ncbi:MAG TPA: LytTR family DNA-binding domain-containing protein [Flavipsychrobacter sp.]|nr:LytTR family DNA-binding domain-containing protein [Flavipsychrobacter sp.]